MRRAIGYGVFPGFVLLMLGSPASASAAQMRPLAATCGPAVPLAEPIARASVRFAIPEPLIRSVIAVESNYAIFAVSPKGAMGLMQLMPETWAGLRLRYALGADPFDPCDNIFAGTAYLRELLDRYGDPGFLAAYNAGPGRYEAYLSGAKPLPAETIDYVARLSSATLGGTSAPANVAPDPEAWRRGGLFVGAADNSSQPTVETEPRGDRPASANETVRPSAAPLDMIFVSRTGVPK